MHEDEARLEDNTGEQPPTPAEHLLYALGQLYRLWYRGALGVAPAALDVLVVARFIGVSRDVEMVTESLDATAYHFHEEVLVAFRGDLHFPWWLLTLDDWALLAELEIFGPG